MSALDQAVQDYLIVRRALGYKLAENGRQLPDFVAYLEAAGARTVTTELAVAWATQPTGCTPVWWARRLAMVRGFACHLKAIDPDTQVPPLGLLPHRCRRVAPYLYSDADVAALMAASRALPSRQRATTYETLVGLLAVTGMRLEEALRLDRDHVDWEEGIVTVWNSKFQKSRALPLHPTTLAALRRYARLRDRSSPHTKAPSFLLSTTGTPARCTWNPPHLPAAGPQRWSRPARSSSASSPRPASHLRGAHPARLVSGGGQRRCLHAVAVDLSGPLQPGEHLLVSLGRPRAASAEGHDEAGRHEAEPTRVGRRRCRRMCSFCGPQFQSGPIQSVSCVRRRSARLSASASNGREKLHHRSR